MPRRTSPGWRPKRAAAAGGVAAGAGGGFQSGAVRLVGARAGAAAVDRARNRRARMGADLRRAVAVRAGSRGQPGRADGDRRGWPRTRCVTRTSAQRSRGRWGAEPPAPVAFPRVSPKRAPDPGAVLAARHLRELPQRDGERRPPGRCLRAGARSIHAEGLLALLADEIRHAKVGFRSGHGVGGLAGGLIPTRSVRSTPSCPRRSLLSEGRCPEWAPPRDGYGDDDRALGSPDPRACPRRLRHRGAGHRSRPGPPRPGGLGGVERAGVGRSPDGTRTRHSVSCPEGPTRERLTAQSST